VRTGKDCEDSISEGAVSRPEVKYPQTLPGGKPVSEKRLNKREHAPPIGDEYVGLVEIIPGKSIVGPFGALEISHLTPSLFSARSSRPYFRQVSSSTHCGKPLLFVPAFSKGSKWDITRNSAARTQWCRAFNFTLLLDRPLGRMKLNARHHSFH
jgi:hypothetical protein